MSGPRYPVLVVERWRVTGRFVGHRASESDTLVPLPDTAKKLPLVIQLEYHPDSAASSRLAQELDAELCSDDSGVPLGIQTVLTPAQKVPPDPMLAPEGHRHLVVALADDHFAADATQPSLSGTWLGYLIGLYRATESSPDARFMPVQLTEHAWPLAEELEELNFLRAWSLNGAEKRRALIKRRIVHLALRRLETPSQQDEDGAPLTVFVSHTKLDLEREPRVVRSLVAHHTATQPQKTWFDSGDIEVGSRFAAKIESGVKDAALLAILTDSFASRSWCRKEVLLAKRFQRPVVVVHAVQEGEPRSFPYLGNVPVVRWQNRAQNVIDALEREALRQRYATAVLEMEKEEDDVLLPVGPELLTLLGRGTDRTFLYPDPPLGEEELILIAETGARAQTPLERHANERQLATRGLSVAVSCSQSSDGRLYGSLPRHLESALLEISRYLLLAGVRLAYGGHLGSDGYTVKLADLLKDPLVRKILPLEKLEPRRPGRAQLANYLPWPTHASASSLARLGSLVEVIRCPRPSTFPEEGDSTSRLARAFGLSQMRQRQALETSARVAIGGQAGGPGAEYSGFLPGVIEETIWSLDAAKPVFLVGGFGGASRHLADCFGGAQTPEELSSHHLALPHNREFFGVEQHKTIALDLFNRLTTHVVQGFSALNNGLTCAENAELATTRATKRIVELVLKGLGASGCSRKSDMGDKHDEGE